MNESWEKLVRPIVERLARLRFRSRETRDEALLFSWLIWKRLGDDLAPGAVVWRALKRAQSEVTQLGNGHRSHMDADDHAVPYEEGRRRIKRARVAQPVENVIAAETLAYLRGVPHATARKVIDACLTVRGKGAQAAEVGITHEHLRRMKNLLARRLARRACD